jgi:hypothetical protein
VTTTAAQTGTALGGLNATSATGNVTIISAGAVTTAAASTSTTAGMPGVYGASSTGNVVINTSGAVTALGNYTVGVLAKSGTGYSNVTVTNVTATGTDSIGVIAESSTGAASVTVAKGGSVTGATYGVAMASTTSMTLNNYGTINGGTFAVFTPSGSSGITITNESTGTINGPVSLGGGGNTVNNAGVWNVSGASYMGTTSTTNVINNAGGTVVAATPAGATGATTATFTNLTAFNNAGGAVDITTGNSIDLGGAVFNGGTNSELRVNPNGPDGLLIVGSSTATTAVVPVDIMTGAAPAMNFTGIPIVQGASASTFVLGNGTDFNAGFVDYRLVYTPASGSSPSLYTIYGLPGQPVFEALNVPYALQNFWRNSTAAFDARAREIRDQSVQNGAPTREGWEFWVQGYGGHDKFDRFTLETFAQAPGFVFRQVGTNNSNFGLQVGGDDIGHWRSGYGYWGFTAGLEQQQSFFPGDLQNDLYALGGNIGLYGGGNFGGFYFDGLGKADFVDMNINFNSAGFSPTHTYEVWGTRGEIGYRWPFAGFFVEPAARVSAEWTNMDNLHPFGALLHYDDNDPIVIGDVGGRVGMTLPLFGINYSAYAGAFWTDQWDGQNRMSFTTFGGSPGTVGSTTILLTQPTVGSAIKVEYGVETGSWYGGFKGFFEGANIVEGNGFGGWSARMGVRFNF